MFHTMDWLVIKSFCGSILPSQTSLHPPLQIDLHFCNERECVWVKSLWLPPQTTNGWEREHPRGHSSRGSEEPDNWADTHTVHSLNRLLLGIIFSWLTGWGKINVLLITQYRVKWWSQLHSHTAGNLKFSKDFYQFNRCNSHGLLDLSSSSGTGN